MSRIPFPTLHTGLTPDDFPYGYSAFTTLLDDHRGYEPVAIGSQTDDAGRTVILVAVSPGAYVSFTLVSTGVDQEQAVPALVEAVRAVRPPGGPFAPAVPAEPPGRPPPGQTTRET